MDGAVVAGGDLAQVVAGREGAVALRLYHDAADILVRGQPVEFRLQRAPIANAVDVAAMMEDEVLAVTASPAAAAAPERPQARRDTVCSVS